MHQSSTNNRTDPPPHLSTPDAAPSATQAQAGTQPPPLVPPETGEAGYLQVSQAFETARRAHPTQFVEADYSLADCHVRLRVVGRELAAIYARAFAPRAGIPAGDAPQLTIDLWDEAVTGQPYPSLAVEQEYQRATESFHVQFVDTSGRWVWSREPHAGTWLDRREARMVGWRAHGARVPNHERSKPLSFLWPLWFYDQDIHVLHASAVARGGEGVLITGGSGIGKTTTALCCLLAGLDYLSDDQVAVRRAPAEAQTPTRFVAHSLFHSARVHPDHLTRFPALQSHAIPGQPPLDPKSLLFMAEQFPTRVVGQATIRAIALPRLAGRAETTVRPASRAEALHYMAHTSLLTSLGIGRARFVHLTGLLGSAPCYWLELGDDFTQIPAVIERLITHA